MTLNRSDPASDQPLSASAAAPTQIPLDENLTRLSRLAEQARDLLFRIDNTLPSAVLDNLNQVISGLNQVRRQTSNSLVSSENLLALLAISQTVNSTLDLNEVLRIVMDTIVRLTGAERGFLMLRNEAGELAIRMARNWEQESINPSEFAISRTVAQRVISEGLPVLTTNAQEDPRFGNQESVVAYNLRSILCVPLKVKDELTGLIYADNRIRIGIFSERDRDLLAFFANQAAVAIENARLFESLRRTLAEVTELQSLMDNVFASMASGVITTDREERITLCNRAAGAILNRPPSGLLGRRLSDLLPGVAAQVSNQIDAIWRSEQTAVGVEVFPSLPGRGAVSLSLNLAPLKDASRSMQGVAIVVDDTTEKRRLQAQRRLFARMVSPAVIDQLDPDQLQLGGKKAEITTLFADIRDFTRFSERLHPERLVSVLNLYLAAAAEAILAETGTIDKFLGDAVMAWFNAPFAQPDHALRAVRAALGIRRAVDKLQGELPGEFHLSFGAGIHFGEAVLGLVGAEERLEYTAIGDSVNTAKRIQENAAAGQILISREVYALVRNAVSARAVEPIQAKGKSQPVEVYEVVGMN